MTIDELLVTDDLRCVVQTAALAEPPAGSAGFARRIVLVELPLPWPKKIDRHPLLAGADGAPPAADKDVKVLGIRSSEATNLDGHRLIVWERTTPFRGFERAETVVSPAELGSAVRHLIDTGPSGIPAPTEPDRDVQDLLICTHGSRDRCCGQLGTRLHLELTGGASGRRHLPADVRIWRTSHTGGHRFAPTAIHLPSGTTWSSLTPALTTSIVDQSVPTHQLAPHFRGNLGIADRPAQIAEGRAFLDRGWPFLEQERTVDIAHDDSGLVRATVRSGTGLHSVDLRAVDSIPVPACGETIDASTKATPQFEIVADTNH